MDEGHTVTPTWLTRLMRSVVTLPGCGHPMCAGPCWKKAGRISVARVAPAATELRELSGSPSRGLRGEAPAPRSFYDSSSAGWLRPDLRAIRRRLRIGVLVGEVGDQMGLRPVQIPVPEPPAAGHDEAAAVIPVGPLGLADSVLGLADFARHRVLDVVRPSLTPEALERMPHVQRERAARMAPLPERPVQWHSRRAATRREATD